MGGREADQITVGRGADMRVKELVLRVGNFPRNQSAHPAGCGVGPRAERQRGRQVAAMRPLGNAAQGISKATGSPGLTTRSGTFLVTLPFSQTTRFFLLGEALPPERCLGA